MLNGFFNMDGPFYKYGTLVFDLMVLNFMWAIFGGPVVVLILLSIGAFNIFANVPILAFVVIFIIMLNMGAATTAMFYVTNRKARDKDGYLFRDFWTSFKMNYKQATVIWAVLLVVFYILWININNISVFGKMASIVLPLQFFIAIEFIFITIYIFPLLARFHMKTKELFKTAFFMANKHLFTTIVNAVIFVAILFLIYKVHPIFMFFLFSGYAMLSSYLFEKVFEKYIPEEDLEDEDDEEFRGLSNYNYEIDQMSIGQNYKEQSNEKDSIQKNVDDNNEQ